MILRNATIRYKGYDPNSLGLTSKLRICCICDKCKRVRYVRFDNYRNLCRSCSQAGKIVSKITKQKMSDGRKGSNNPFYGKHHSDESKKLMGNAHLDISGDKNHFYGKHHTDESKKLMRDNSPNRSGENHPNWKGGFDTTRSYVLPEIQCRKMNTRFEGSEFHHLSKSYGIYIPKILHRHLYHNLKSGQGMDEMSILAFQFIKGEL